MAFLYSAIGDNTRENREHLEKLGYKPNYIYDKQGVLYTRNDISNYYVCFIENIKHECVNCIGNPALFQAVTAMRDDTDKWQFFVHEDGSFVFCDQGELKHVIDNEYMYQEYAVSEFHKATIDEIIKRFTKDENMQ